ncbi:MAG: MBL fold metallo-hydrolase [Candidatus Aminicenantales bacterium]
MKLEFLGVRGSIPVSDTDKKRYGGHTTCLLVTASSGELIIIDSGTGIIKLGKRLKEKRGKLSLYILFTHFHLDHIIGLPFFYPLYFSVTEISFYAHCSPRRIKKYLANLIGGRYFPIDFMTTPSKKVFSRVPVKPFQVGSVEISFCPLRHPQGSVGYRFEENGKRVVIATDTEHPENSPDEKLAAFARGADVLVYDAYFTPEEYEDGRKNWGHSTWLEGTKLAQEAGVSKLYLTHFNPGHSDELIDNIISLSREKFPETYAATEGEEIVL